MVEHVPERPLTDALSETTRRERKALLATNVVVAAVLYGRLIPNRISAFGIDVENVSARSLAFVLLAMLVYFLAAFSLYAWADSRSYVRDARPIFSALATELAKPRIKARVETRTAGLTEPVSEELVQQIVREVVANGLSEAVTNDTMRALRPYLFRFYFDVGFPLIITVNNICGVLYVGSQTDWVFR